MSKNDRMTMRPDAELLRYVSLVLIGLLLTLGGSVVFMVAGSVEANIQPVIPRVAEQAPEALPALQSVQSFVPTVRAFAGLIVFTGLFTLVSGVLSIRERRKRAPAWSYYESQSSGQDTRQSA